MGTTHTCLPGESLHRCDRLRVHLRQDSPSPFSKKRLLGPFATAWDGDFGSRRGFAKGHLRQRPKNSTLAHVMHGSDAFLGQNFTGETVQFFLRLQVGHGRFPGQQAVNLLKIKRGPEPSRGRVAEQKNFPSPFTEDRRQQFHTLFHLAHHPDHRSRMDRAGG